MTFLAAIKSNLMNSLSFRGRTTRAEFWYFAPFGLAIGIFGCWIGARLLTQNQPLSLVWFAALTFLSFMPLMAAGSRRLQDSGENGQDIFLPMAPFLLFSLFFSLSAHGAFGVFIAFLTLPTFGIILGLAYWFLIVAILVLAPITGLLFVGSTIGQLLVPSDPSSNRFGPNPNEVLS